MDQEVPRSSRGAGTINSNDLRDEPDLKTIRFVDSAQNGSHFSERSGCGRVEAALSPHTNPRDVPLTRGEFLPLSEFPGFPCRTDVLPGPRSGSALDIPEQISSCLLASYPSPLVGELDLERVEEALHRHVIVAAGCPVHGYFLFHFNDFLFVCPRHACWPRGRPWCSEWRRRTSASNARLARARALSGRMLQEYYPLVETSSARHISWIAQGSAWSRMNLKLISAFPRGGRSLS